MPQRVLALDLMTTTGWALQNDVGDVVSGVQKFAKGPRDGDGDRLLRFSTWLASIPVTYRCPLDLIVYERAFGAYKGRQAQHLFSHFEACVLLWAARHDVPTKAVAQATLKLQAAGSGRADKSHVQDAVRAMGYAFADDNEADALALLLTTTGRMKATPWPKAPRKSKAKAEPLPEKPF